MRPTLCLICGQRKKLIAHHYSYHADCMLDVAWVCEKCHRNYCFSARFVEAPRERKEARVYVFSRENLHELDALMARKWERMQG